MTNRIDKRSFDISASREVQDNLRAIINRLEDLIGLRSQNVQALLANWEATGVSGEYHGKEGKWLAAADETRDFITLVKKLLEENDSIAHMTLGKARAIVNDL
ncbi:pore-forming ESAT-6 family protein [Actinomadura montaniterrae]|uniref:Uncharacterized protein n=1 Tax=Actinomadura montaniterrae TaxID=1803903 RepID=A0A6L3W1S1_9ACTN|nr:pore-forming ESAT-6 family protein [Actinomadura montaniterrae]KAB2388801.1 hypothetical protein F9B16_02450 [Actinomadura montaniterrae]